MATQEHRIVTVQAGGHSRARYARVSPQEDRRGAGTLSWPRTEINVRLPARIDEIYYNDPLLTLSGEGWYLKLGCPWSGEIDGVQLSWEDDDVEDHAWELIGSSLITVEDGSPGELSFTFTNGVLRVRPDTDLDPWVLSLPDFVAVGGMLN